MHSGCTGHHGDGVVTLIMIIAGGVVQGSNIWCISRYHSLGLLCKRILACGPYPDKNFVNARERIQASLLQRVDLFSLSSTSTRSFRTVDCVCGIQRF